MKSPVAGIDGVIAGVVFKSDPSKRSVDPGTFDRFLRFTHCLPLAAAKQTVFETVTLFTSHLSTRTARLHVSRHLVSPRIAPVHQRAGRTSPARSPPSRFASPYHTRTDSDRVSESPSESRIKILPDPGGYPKVLKFHPTRSRRPLRRVGDNPSKWICKTRNERPIEEVRAYGCQESLILSSGWIRSQSARTTAARASLTSS
jgi:hypothetical protein